MRSYGLYDASRGLTLALAAALAGLGLWGATQVGMQTTGRFWLSMLIVAGAGLVIALAGHVGTWTKGLRLRVSPGTFGWAGAYGTNQNMDPKEKLVSIVMMQGASGPLQRDFEALIRPACHDIAAHTRFDRRDLGVEALGDDLQTEVAVRDNSDETAAVATDG